MLFRSFVGATENLLSLCPANASTMLLSFVATRAGSVDKSVGSAGKSVGLLHLYTLRNALKISLVQTKSAECRQIAQKVL